MRSRLVVAGALSIVFTLFAFEPATAAEPANVTTAKRVFLEKMGQGRFDRLDEIYGPGFVAHGADRDYTLDEDNESGRQWRAAFPDLVVEVLRTVADDTLVAVHWRGSGTNTVAAAGMPGKGARATIEGMTFFRFADARIVEEWSIIDIASLMRQMSAPPK
jgi:predicted ester cyclase